MPQEVSLTSEHSPSLAHHRAHRSRAPDLHSLAAQQAFFLSSMQPLKLVFLEKPLGFISYHRRMEVQWDWKHVKMGTLSLKGG
jgi:hypothetical protein